MTRIFTLEEVRAAALAALEAEGDHVYKAPVGCEGGCLYTTPEGAPSCLVGHVIARLEPEILPQLTQWEWKEVVTSFLASDLNEGEHRFGSDSVYEQKAIEWLRQAQRRQDGGDPWSVAIEYADLNLRAA